MTTATRPRALALRPRSPRRRPWWRAATIAGTTAALLLLGGGVALAHPALRPAEAPAGEPTELELVMEHDCDPVDGADDPTTSVAIQVPEALASTEALPLTGWETSSETDGEGRTTVIEWTVADGALPETPPTLPLRVTPDTADEPLDLDLVVLQECAEGSYLWGGGDEDEPPVALTVTPGTFDRPTPTTASTPAATTSPTATPTPSAPTPTAPATAPTSGSDPSSPSDESGAFEPVLWALGAFAAAAVAVGLLALRRRRTDG